MKAFSLCASALVMLLPAHASAGECEPNALAKNTPECMARIRHGEAAT